MAINERYILLYHAIRADTMYHASTPYAALIYHIFAIDGQNPIDRHPRYFNCTYCTYPFHLAPVRA